MELVEETPPDVTKAELHKPAAGQIRGCSLVLGHIFLEPGYRFRIMQPSTEHNYRHLKGLKNFFFFISFLHACLYNLAFTSLIGRPTANFISSSYDFMRQSLSFRDINN